MTTTGQIATPHRDATRAGEAAFAQGGSAVDAALAAAAVLTVVYPHNCALGGDLIALVREPDGTTTTVNASGAAAAATDVDAVRARHGGTMPIVGIDAVTVPGLVAGWEALHARGARLGWNALLVPAQASAASGVTVGAKLAAAITETPGVLHDAGMRGVFAPAGRPLAAGETLRQPALAATLATLAADGPRALYRGPLAAGLAKLGSAIDADDLAGFAARVEEPVAVDLRDGLRLLTAAPNSAGVLLAQALLALDAAGLREPLGVDAGALGLIFGAGTAQREAQLADGAWEREAWLGDTRIAAVAQGRATAAARSAPRPAGDTVAIVATDADGRAVSLIQSLFHGFGAQLLEPETGVLLHNRGAGFTLQAGHPNVLAPRKRPAHTLMPVMVQRAGELQGVLGTMGGRVQAQIHAQVLRRLLDGASAQEAVSAPRFAVGAMEMGEPAHTVRVEEDCAPAVMPSLRAAGLLPVAVPPRSEELGHAQAIWRGAGVGTDPRADG